MWICLWCEKRFVLGKIYFLILALTILKYKKKQQTILLRESRNKSMQIESLGHCLYATKKDRLE